MLRISYGFQARVNDVHSMNGMPFKYGKEIFMLGRSLSVLGLAGN
jgi:hypothetical protein